MAGTTPSSLLSRRLRAVFLLLLLALAACSMPQASAVPGKNPGKGVAGRKAAPGRKPAGAARPRGKNYVPIPVKW